MNKTFRNKILALFAVPVLAWNCCGCGENVLPNTAPSPSETINRSSAVSGEASDSLSRTGDSDGVSGLRFLCRDDGEASCSGRQGYYYLSQSSIPLSDGSYGSRLMYMDYASCREIYLCSSPGCAHDTPDCTAVLPNQDFNPFSAKLFLHEDSLYILARQYDTDGTMVISGADESGEDFLQSGNTMETQSSLYRMNPDGTGRQKVYTFDNGLTLEGTLAADDKGLYVIAKKLSTEQSGGAGYTSASERRLLFLDLSSFTVREICSLDFGDNITWQMTGCAGGSVLFRGTDFGRKLTREEYYDDDMFRNYFSNSVEIFAALDVGNAENVRLREFFRTDNQSPLSAAVLDGTLYIGTDGSGEIIGVDITSGEQRVLSSLPQNYLWGALGNMLYCSSWDLTADHTYYFVDTATGEVKHSGLVNKSLGWSLDIKAETDTDVLVIYDYESTPSELNEGAYEIHRYQYGLISKEDLCAGNDAYRKIQMVGKGE